LTVAAAVVVGVAFAAAAAFVALRPAAPSADSVVRQYFSDLADDNTSAALGLVGNASQYPPDVDPLLTRAALADPASRPAGLTIGTSDSRQVQGVTVQSVQVSYSLGGQTVHQTIDAVANGASMLLSAPFLNLEIRAADHRTVVVNGIALGTIQPRMAVFPGVYRATEVGDALLSSDTETSAVQPEPALVDLVTLITFPAARITAGAAAEIDAKVKRLVDTCASITTTFGPSGCPFNLPPDGYLSLTSVTWSVLSYPTLRLIPVIGPDPVQGQVSIATTTPGKVHYRFRYVNTYYGTDRIESADETFTIGGFATAAGSDISLSEYPSFLTG
jgi:hypothetical protein